MTYRHLPLCVDLDGTLIGSDTFDESLAKALRSPRALLDLIAALPAGKARTKAVLAGHCRPDPRLLPYHGPFLEFLGEERRAGRTLVLVTAANEDIARSVADHLGLFDEVLASTSARNLRGKEKGKALTERFGERGFVYAGNDRTDLAVWPLGAAAIVVGAPRSVASSLDEGFVERAFPRARGGGGWRLIGVAQSWKSLAALVPLGLAPPAPDPGWALVLAVPVCLSCLFAALYVSNDLLDLEHDRAAGRDRPLAGGTFPVRGAFLIMAAAGLTAAAGAIVLGAAVAALAIATLHVLYSARLQRSRLAGPIALGGLYLGRITFGAAAFDSALSPSHWAGAALACLLVGFAGRRWWSALDET